MGEVSGAFNALVAQDAALAQELRRVADAVEVRGHTSERASLPGADGSWASAIDSVNAILEPLAWQTEELSLVLNRLARGDLSQSMPIAVGQRPLQGDLRVLADSVNAVASRLVSVASQVSHVLRKIGTEGRLGVTAVMDDSSGTWKGLVDNVNLLSENLTAQVRNIALVTTAIAHGDLSEEIGGTRDGEILELKHTVNAMVDQLRAFASEVNAWRRRSAPKASSAARQTCRVCPGRGRGSRIASTCSQAI